jgi:acyl-CoA dehydrogenase
MAWDFSTDPEIQEQLDWIDRFVREEIWPLETLDLDLPALERVIAPLRARVKQRGLWATHLPPELGGQGWG